MRKWMHLRAQCSQGVNQPEPGPFVRPATRELSLFKHMLMQGWSVACALRWFPSLVVITGVSGWLSAYSTDLQADSFPASVTYYVVGRTGSTPQSACNSWHSKDVVVGSRCCNEPIPTVYYVTTTPYYSGEEACAAWNPGYYYGGGWCVSIKTGSADAQVFPLYARAACETSSEPIGAILTCPTGATLSGSTCASPSPGPASPIANIGVPDYCPAGNPINQGTRSKLLPQTDYYSNTLSYVRTYNSNALDTTTSGKKWRNSFNRSITLGTAGTDQIAVVYRHDGKAYNFFPSGSGYQSRSTSDQLTRLVDSNGVTAGWRYTVAADNSVENYDAAGKLLSITDQSSLTQTLTYSTASTPYAVAPRADLLLSVTDAFAKNFTFTYDTQGRILSLTDPAGEMYRYAYDINGNLATVSYPDQTPTNNNDNPTRIYIYNEPAYTSGANLPDALTGIIDENGTRYATYTYDATGKALSTEHAGGAERHSLTYGTNSATVTDPLGTARTHTFQTILGVVKSTGQSQPGGAGCGPASSATTYDANGNVASRADFNGHKSCYAYDLTRNLETARVEGLATGLACPANLVSYVPTPGTAQRKILTDWHPNLRLPVKITEAGRETTHVYDTRGTLTSRSIKDTVTTKTRTWTTTPTYHATVPGVLVKTVDNGPRIDVADLTTTDYYAPDATCPGAALLGCRGQIKQITNALGHVTTYNEYDAHGRVKKLTDPNAVVTTFAYSPRGWLQSRVVDGKATVYDYTPWGGLAKVTYPDATWISYSYDPAHRLTRITDSANRRVDYTLDNAGNRTKETFVNADATPAREVNRVFDALGRLKDEIKGAVGAPPRTYGYYANGEAKFSTTPKGGTTSAAIDALGRAVQQTDPVNGSAKPTLMQYDSLDQLVTFTAPNGTSTAFTYDNLGNLKQENSADCGTLDAGYDDAGNQLTGKDARGLTLTYQYDALDRLTRIDAPAGGGLAASTTVLTWDAAAGCTYGIGRLCRIADGAGSTTFAYDARGNLVSETRVEGGATFVTNYFHNNADRLTDVTLPSGEVMQAGLDTSGRIKTLSITRNGVVTQVADGIEYAATGQIRRQTLGQTVIAQSFDAAGRLDTEAATVGPAPSDGDVPLPAWALWLLGAALASAITQKRAALAASLVLICGLMLATSFHPVYAADLDLGYDANGNVISKATPGGTATFSYDPLDRIDTEAGPTGTRNHDFDGGGNRTTDGAGTTTSFTPSTDRLATINGVAVTLDAAGNLTSDGTYKYLWNSLGQLGELRKLDNTLIATYYYDYRNLRTRKVTTAAAPQGVGTVFYHYVKQGHLTAETTGNTPQATYLWNGDILTGLIVHQPTRTVYTVQTDHLGSPFQVRTLAGQVVWRWESEAFGKTAPNEDVDGDGVKLTLNLRFPGQYFDKESGLHYNWNRYYSPKLGRYMSPDPIGLSGGANLFAYARGNPTNRIDPLGLSDVFFDRGAGTITVTDGNGNTVGTFPAANNTTSSSNGPWPDGTYPYSHYVSHPESGANGPYGSNGNFVFAVPGRTGMGIHSGRNGPQSKTLGCVRTTDEATDFLRDLHANDPLRTIKVK